MVEKAPKAHIVDLDEKKCLVPPDLTVVQFSSPSGSEFISVLGMPWFSSSTTPFHPSVPRWVSSTRNTMKKTFFYTLPKSGKRLSLRWGVPLHKEGWRSFLGIHFLLQDLHLVFEAVPPVPLSETGNGRHSLSTSSFLHACPPFPLCFRRLDCESLSHPMDALVFIPFLTARWAPSPSFHCFLGGGRVRQEGLALWAREGGGTSVKRKLQSGIEKEKEMPP